MLCLCCSELRERIQPEILELIKQQRLNRLCEGSCFRKLGNRRRQGIDTIAEVFLLFFFPFKLVDSVDSELRFLSPVVFFFSPFSPLREVLVLQTLTES